MKKINLFAAAGLFVIVTSLLATSAANAWIVGSGSNCEAANLNQALAGIGWSQVGVVNNATIPFFVVCPIDYDSTNPIPQTIMVGASFPGNGVVECTGRVESHTNATYTSVSFTVSAGQNTVSTTRGMNFAGLMWPASGYNSTVVCALDPGEGITFAYSY